MIQTVFSKLVFAISVCLLLPIVGETKQITISTGEYPPFYIDSSENKGFALELVKEAFAAVDIDVRFQFFPWARVESQTKYGEVDASCCWFRKEAREEYGIHSEPIYHNSFSFFYLKKNQFEPDTVESIKNTRIGLTRGYSYPKELLEAEKDNTITISEVSSDLQNLELLLVERIELFPLSTVVGQYLIRKNFSAEDQKKFTHHHKPLLEDSSHLLFPKSNPDSKYLLTQFNKGLRIIRENRRYEQILEEFNTLYPHR